MKLHHIIFTILITLFPISCYGQTIGFIVNTVVDPDNSNITTMNQLNYAVDQQSYTNGVGGITFSYPAGWFDQPPFVQVSIIQNVTHPTTEAYVAEVSANSTTSTTVMVYLVNSGVVSEAATGTITVTLWAVDDPV